MAEKTKHKRLFDLHRRLICHGRLSIQMMMDDYGINRRTANRDINDLQSMGVHLESETLENGMKVWFLPASRRQITIPFNLTDVAALFLGRGLFEFCKGTLLDDSLNKIFETIEAQISKEKDLIRLRNLKRKMYIVSDGPKHLPEDKIEELDEVLTGLLDERHIRFDYVSSGGLRSTFTAIPLSLVAYKMGLYLLAQPLDPPNAPARIFAVERMTGAEALRGTRYQLPKDFSPASFFEDALFIQKGTPTEVELIFDKSSHPFISIRKFHFSQKLKRLPDGRTRMTLTVPSGADDFEIVNWIISFHRHVKVISPKTLADTVRDRLASALAQYQ